MRKIVKILLIILFIIFILGITISCAKLTVNVDTEVEDMLAELNPPNNGYLTGISNVIRDGNDYLYCTQRDVYIYDYAQYKIANRVTYPGDGSDDGYARAYVIAADGYDKSDGDPEGLPTPTDERQWAWYYYEDHPDAKNEPNDLIKIADAYQEYKMRPFVLEVKPDSAANTTINGNKIIYGPIKINYSYGKGEGSSKSDQWGGFSYAIFDESGSNISRTEKAQLCKLTSNSTYQSISSNGDSNGYYKVDTGDYINEDLYVVINNDQTIKSCMLKLQGNTVDYTATAYNLEAEVNLSKDGISICDPCRNKMTTDYERAIGNKNLIVVYDGKYYKYNREGTPEDSKSTSVQKHEIVDLGGIQIETSIDSDEIVGSAVTKYKTASGTYTESRSEAKDSFRSKLQDGIDEDGETEYWCSCHTWYSSNPDSLLERHMQSATFKKYSVVTYYFTEWSGCGRVVDDGKSVWTCGDPYSAGKRVSQGLLLVDGSESTRTIAAEKELSIQFESVRNIKVTKVWVDSERGGRSK